MAENHIVNTCTAIVKFVGSEKEYEYFMTKQIFESDFDRRGSTRYFRITNEKGYTYGTPIQFVRYNFKPTIMAQRTIVTAVEMEKDSRSSTGFLEKNRIENCIGLDGKTYTTQKAPEPMTNSKRLENRFEINDVRFNIDFESWTTTIYWKDGDSTSIVCRGKVDRDAGIALCFMKKATESKFVSILDEYGEE